MSTHKANCPVCLDPFTNVIRQPITCPYCPHANCRQCTAQYLLSSLEDPHCMGCKREWNREFIDLHLTKTFRTGALRHHRRKVLMDREKGRLPAMQVFAEAQLQIDNYTKISDECGHQIWTLKRRKTIICTSNALSPEELAEEVNRMNREIKQEKVKLAAAEEEIRRHYRILNGRDTEPVRQFIMKCPFEGCRGFLSTAWKCGTCLKFFCSDCHAEKAGQRDDSHVCNEDAKATASMIRQETKPCPKCGIRISKIDGCDQMWCVSCQTTFSWNTGQILLNTVVHNPHYYEYLRRVNNGSIPREAGDVPCGGLPGHYAFHQVVQRTTAITEAERNELYNIHRRMYDIQEVRLPRYPLRQPANVNKDLDIQFLLNRITEEQWGEGLERLETRFERNKEIGLILQTLLHVGAEKLTLLFNTSLEQRNRIAPQIIQELRDVRDYTNRALLQKGIQMNIVVPKITAEWEIVNVSKAEMKNALNQPHTQESAVIPSARPMPQEINYDDNDDTEITLNPNIVVGNIQAEHTVEVEINGETLRMNYQQALEMMV